MTSVTNQLDEVRKISYNLQNKVSSVTQPNGSVISYDYDKLDKLVGKTSKTDETVNAMYGYDEDGRKISMTDIAGTTKYAYDKAGRITALMLSNGDMIEYRYDSFGNLKELIYPDKTRVIYKYDELDRLTKITDRGGNETSYTYDTAGNMTGVVRPNGTSTKISYDKLGNITELINLQANKEISRFTYTYDLSGYITKEEAKQGKTTLTREFTYDNRGQIIEIIEKSGTLTTYMSYEYDENGNRIKEINKRGNQVIKQVTNTYDAVNRVLQSVDTANWDRKVTSFVYDKNGNVVRKNMPYSAWVSYKYDAENRLSAIRDNNKLLFAALYDGNGDRIFSVVPKENTGNWHDDGNNGQWQSYSSNKTYDDGSWNPQKYVYPLTKEQAAEIKATDRTTTTKTTVSYDKDLIDNTIFIPNGINQWNKERYELTGYINDVNTEHTQVLMEYGTSGKIGAVYEYGVSRESMSVGSKVNYYAYDGRGNVSELMNAIGGVNMSYSYGAFGKTSTKVTTYTRNSYTYNSENVDLIPGVPDLQYLRARYYDPNMGRFMQQDTLFGEMERPLTQNLYVYCLNNGVNLRDPSGNASLADLRAQYERAQNAGAGASVLAGIQAEIDKLLRQPGPAPTQKEAQEAARKAEEARRKAREAAEKAAKAGVTGSQLDEMNNIANNIKPSTPWNDSGSSLTWQTYEQSTSSNNYQSDSSSKSDDFDAERHKRMIKALLMQEWIKSGKGFNGLQPTENPQVRNFSDADMFWVKVGGTASAIFGGAEISAGAGVGIGAELETSFVGASAVAKNDLISAQLDGNGLFLGSKNEGSIGVNSIVGSVSATTSTKHDLDAPNCICSPFGKSNIFNSQYVCPAWSEEVVEINSMTFGVSAGLYFGIGAEVSASYNLGKVADEINRIWRTK